MKLHLRLLIFFAALLLLTALGLNQNDFMFWSGFLIPVFIVWHVIIVLRDPGDHKQKPEFNDRWYENP
ncbi:MAG: hypothetical protein IT259_10355 [Saprospiraceae bacterium]|nr:hypothetical protein [Saprospiraceae bacterium]